MSTQADRVVRAVAIPRLDADGLGIHLAWSGPELLALAIDGYEVRRRPVRYDKTTMTCAVFDAARLALLAQTFFLPDELGTMLMGAPGTATPPPPPPPDVTWDDPAGAGGGAVAEFAGHQLAADGTQIKTSPAPVEGPPGPGDLGGGSEPPGAPNGPTGRTTHGPTGTASAGVVVLTQELTVPADLVTVRCEATSAVVIAISAGKAVGTASVPSGGAVLYGPYIDTVVIYAAGLTQLSVCAEDPVADKALEVAWSAADVLATGLTLPLHETDPTLTTAADELQTARGRLLAAEKLTTTDATHLFEALRAAAGAPGLGRPCDRVILDRTDTDTPFVETLFTTRMALLALDPKLRRTLGFGFVDLKAVPGQTYDYLVSGTFDTADLADDCYDVHTVPSGTTLPTTVRIRDLTLRFGAPAQVVLDPPPVATDLTGVSRRGIAVAPSDPIDGFIPWWTPQLSCVIDLPRPTRTVILEVPAKHTLTCSGALASDVFVPAPVAVPAGPKAVLTFATAVDQLRISGSGTLFAVRPGDASTGTITLYRTCPAVEFAARPLPPPPVAATATNLQQPPVILVGNVDEETELPARPQPGFIVAWWPTITGAFPGWPVDLDAAPPVEALAFVVEHRRVYTAASPDPWEATQSGDNLTFGSWPARLPPSLAFGADLDQVFPLHRARATGAAPTMSLTDVLSEQATTGDPPRAAAPLGSYHQYRVQAMDVVGRVSATWTESNSPRLEKRVPPPLPVGPQPPPAVVGNPPRLAGPVGVRARCILASDPDLSAADSTLLAGHPSAVLVEWGWRQSERDLDGSTSEFRVYVQHQVPTEVPCVVQSVASAPGQWVLTTTTDRYLVPDESIGQWISTGAGAFRIATHTGGTTPTVIVDAGQLAPSQPPSAGPAMFGRPLTPLHQRPGSWLARVGVVPLTADDTYRYVVFDLLSVTADQRLDQAWVGVSAADAEPYVDDELPAAVPNGGRPGNESSVAAVTVGARYRGRPVFSLPPPVGDVPEVVTQEPTGRQVGVDLDAVALLAGALPTTARVALDRCSSEDILAVTSVTAQGDVRIRRADGSFQTVVFANPAEAATVRAVLESPHPELLPSRYLLFLLGHSDRPEELFDRTGGTLQPANALADALAPRPGRQFYRVRLADAAGAVGEGGAILPVVVRVPSTAPGPTPTRHTTSSSGGAIDLELKVDPDPDAAWVLLFTRIADWDQPSPDAAAARVVRMPNRRDLYPDDGIRLRLGDGSMLAPVAKSLADADVAIDGDGRLSVPISQSLPTGGGTGKARQVQCWCLSLSRDGIPSRTLGPFTVLAAGAP